MTPTLELSTALINRASVTPEDNGCQRLLAQRLTNIGFDCQHLRFGDVDNLWAVRGSGAPLFVFAGHTDVVPAGDLNQWHSPPFSATVRDGKLYGRGAADMKSNIAAMVVAVEQFVAQNPNHTGQIAFLITSDEEGDAANGTVKVVEYLQQQGIQIDYCLVGEPSSSDKIADVIKNGRRGSLGARLKIIGKQGHVAYPQNAKNPIHLAAPFLAEFCAQQWDAGNAFFPATSMQISNINAGTGATNVIPQSCEVVFNFRYSTETTHTQLQQKVLALLQKFNLDYEINWHHSGAPFITETGALLAAIDQAVNQICGYRPTLSTSGGTSDGRFIAPTGAQVVELGVQNESIHQINEWVDVDFLEQLTQIYQQVLDNLYQNRD